MGGSKNLPNLLWRAVDPYFRVYGAVFVERCKTKQRTPGKDGKRD